MRTMRTPTIEPWLVGLTTNGAGIGSRGEQRLAARDHAADHRQAGIAMKIVLGGRLVHRQRRGEHPRMGVGDRQHLADALHRAVLAADPVQRVEDQVGPRVERAQQRRQVAADIDRS